MSLRLRSASFVLIAAFTFAFSASAAAQVTDVTQSNQSGATRTVGRKGAKQLTFGGSVTATQRLESDFFTGVEESKWSGDYSANFQQGFFATNRLVFSFGTMFGGSIGGGSRNTGFDGGMTLYTSPNSRGSVYVGAGAGVLVFANDSGGQTFTSNFGNVFGNFGFESVIGPSSSQFFELQVGRTLSEGGQDNRVLVRFGLRFVY